MVGETLRRLGVPPHDVVIIFEFDLAPAMPELSQSHEFYLRFDDAGHLLGAPYAPSLITLNTTGGMLELRPFHEVLRRWADQNSSTRKFAMGITVSRSSELDTIPNVAELGYVHLKHGPNILDHSTHRVEQIKCLAEQDVGVISSNVFAGGFLVGGRALNGRTIDLDTRADESLVAWRKAFTALCHGHGVRPAHACIQYALSTPGVAAVSLSTSNAERVVEAVHAATTQAPSALWASMKEEGLLAR
jgi:D-threo-aldose 1-dehydrogenase